jgi:hypothetical protein
VRPTHYRSQRCGGDLSARTARDVWIHNSHGIHKYGKRSDRQPCQQHRFLLGPIRGVCTADGCHLKREPVMLVREAGFTIEHVEERYAKGPKPWSWFTAGIATNPR